MPKVAKNGRGVGGGISRPYLPWGSLDEGARAEVEQAMAQFTPIAQHALLALLALHAHEQQDPPMRCSSAGTLSPALSPLGRGFEDPLGEAVSAALRASPMN
jgi:hypothetical protein